MSTEVFDYTQDYSKRLEWDTFLRKANLLGGAKRADNGVKTYCEAKNGIGLETEYVSFNRPKVTAIKMTKPSFMFRSFAGSWTYRELENKITEVVFLYSYELNFPFNIVSFIITKVLRKNVKQRLIDLKTHMENHLIFS